MKLLITGSHGWIGNALRVQAQSMGHDVAGTTRQALQKEEKNIFNVGHIDGKTNWTAALAGCEVVFHLAAHVHITNAKAGNDLALFRQINTAGTQNLALQAAASGVSRFIFVSSIKVHGEQSNIGRPFCADDTPKPTDAYGISKLEAEECLREISAKTNMDVVIVRPPLVYGVGVKANFAALVRAVERGIPLPFASVTSNRRSLIALDNLTDFLMLCATHPAAARKTFLVCDGPDLSTRDLIEKIATAAGRSPRLWPFPVSLLRRTFQLLGKEAMIERLIGNLQVDMRPAQHFLGWMPPTSVDAALSGMFAAQKEGVSH